MQLVLASLGKKTYQENCLNLTEQPFYPYQLMYPHEPSGPNETNVYPLGHRVCDRSAMSHKRNSYTCWCIAQSGVPRCSWHNGSDATCRTLSEVPCARTSQWISPAFTCRHLGTVQLRPVVAEAANPPLFWIMGDPIVHTTLILVGRSSAIYGLVIIY